MIPKLGLLIFSLCGMRSLPLIKVTEASLHLHFNKKANYTSCLPKVFSILKYNFLKTISFHSSFNFHYHILIKCGIIIIIINSVKLFRFHSISVTSQSAKRN
jgi:hypothetical protein